MHTICFKTRAHTVVTLLNVKSLIGTVVVLFANSASYIFQEHVFLGLHKEKCKGLDIQRVLGFQGMLAAYF